MKSLKLTLALALSLLVMSTFATSAKANTDIEQDQSQELELTCEVGSYGQTVNCYAKGQQDQSFKATIEEQDGKTVIVRDGRVIPVHQVADTALDLQGLMAAAGTLVTGAAATFVKFKTRS